MTFTTQNTESFSAEDADFMDSWEKLNAEPITRVSPEYFTTQNIEGFSAEEIDTLNEAYDALLDAGMGDAIPEDHHSDVVFNGWLPGDTVETLVARVRKQRNF